MRQYYNIVLITKSHLFQFPMASGILAENMMRNTKFSDHRTTRRDFKPGVS